MATLVSTSTLLKLEQVKKAHYQLQLERARVRNHKNVLKLMKICWHRIPKSQPNVMNMEEFQQFYSTLLREMTLSWNEELNHVVVQKMWQRDVHLHLDLNLERFYCSFFYYTESWVENINRIQYEKVLYYISDILGGLEPQLVVLKPTLEKFNNAIDNERMLEELQINIGRSLRFKAERFIQHFGPHISPDTYSKINLLQATLRAEVHLLPDSTTYDLNSGLHLSPLWSLSSPTISNSPTCIKRLESANSEKNSCFRSFTQPREEPSKASLTDQNILNLVESNTPTQSNSLDSDYYTLHPVSMAQIAKVPARYQSKFSPSKQNTEAIFVSGKPALKPIQTKRVMHTRTTSI